MMAPAVGTAMALLLAAADGGVETGGDTCAGVPFHFDGVVHIDRAGVMGLNALCRNQVIAWMCDRSQRLRRGEPLMIFDTLLLQQRLAQRELEWTEARARLAYDERRLASELEALREEKTALEADLAVVSAGLAAARRLDRNRADLLGAEHQRERQKVEDLRRELALLEHRFKLGEIPHDDLIDARLRWEQAGIDAELARLRWEHERGRADDFEIERLMLRERELRTALGLERERPHAAPPDHGQAGGADAGASPEDADTCEGIERRIAALSRKVDSERAKNQAALQRARRQRHEALRDAYDHTPINFLEVLAAETRAPQLRIVFGPAGHAPPEGYAHDDGAPFDDGRGFGWDADHRGDGHRREVTDPLQSGVLRLRGPAVWQARCPDGRYVLRLGVGDDVDWHGPLIRLGAHGHHGEEPAGAGRPLAGQVLFHKGHLETPEVVEQTIDVTDGVLALTFGDRHAKAMRATEDGVGSPQPWLQLGRRVSWTGWPVVYFSPASRYRVKALVHQQMVGLLRTEAEEAEPAAEQASSLPPAVRVAAARRAASVCRVDMVTAGAVRCAGTVSEVGTAPVRITRGASVWWWGGEARGKDLIAREVLITPDADAVAGLYLGESVRCTARVPAPAGATVLPGHLVAEDPPHGVIVAAADGRERSVVGFRVGASFVVLTEGVEAEGLVPPLDVTVGRLDQHRRYPGEVVAGRRDAVGIPHYWGRIREMTEHGRDVVKGELIVTLYNPSLESNRERLREEKVKARQNYLVAAETRRVKTIEARVAHDAKLLAEQEARITLRELDQAEPLAVAEARSARDKARAEDRVRADRLQRHSALGAAGVAAARFAARRAALRHRGAQLAYVAARRRADWPARLEARWNWLAAIEDLSLRELALAIVRQEEKVARLQAELELHRAMEGGWRERVFEEIRRIHAPATGRLFYLTSWNDHTRARTRITKDFVVWGGLPIAEVLDMSRLGLEAELPERLYGQIEEDAVLSVGFDQFPGVRLESTVEAVGRRFYVPKEEQGGGAAERSESHRRVFTVKVLFSPPPALAQRLAPGARGFVELP